MDEEEDLEPQCSPTAIKYCILDLFRCIAACASITTFLRLLHCITACAGSTVLSFWTLLHASNLGLLIAMSFWFNVWNGVASATVFLIAIIASHAVILLGSYMTWQIDRSTTTPIYDACLAWFPFDVVFFELCCFLRACTSYGFVGSVNTVTFIVVNMVGDVLWAIILPCTLGIAFSPDTNRVRKRIRSQLVAWGCRCALCSACGFVLSLTLAHLAISPSLRPNLSASLDMFVIVFWGGHALASVFLHGLNAGWRTWSGISLALALQALVQAPSYLALFLAWLMDRPGWDPKCETCACPAASQYFVYKISVMLQALYVFCLISLLGAASTRQEEDAVMAEADAAIAIGDAIIGGATTAAGPSGKTATL